MATRSYVTKEALSYFWTKAKTYINDAIQDVTLTLDTALSDTSENAVQNKVIKAALDLKADATAIPTAVSQLTNDSDFQTGTEVESAITSKGYQTEAQVATAITSKGYQTSEQVETAITGKGYQTATQVDEAITAKGYQTSTEVEAAITGKGYQTEEQMTTAIATAVGSITEFDTQVVDALPGTGVKGTIYFKANSGEAPNIYDEYLWIGTAFEKVGSTEVDLTGYTQDTDFVDVTTSDIDQMFAA